MTCQYGYYSDSMIDKDMMKRIAPPLWFHVGLLVLFVSVFFLFVPVKNDIQRTCIGSPESNTDAHSVSPAAENRPPEIRGTTRNGEGSNDTRTNMSEDSDGDGASDASEITEGSDPHDPASTPLDWDGDGHDNGDDRYPRDPSRWRDDRMDWSNVLIYLGGAFLTIFLAFIAYVLVRRRRYLREEPMDFLYRFISDNPGENHQTLGTKMPMRKDELDGHLERLEATCRINTVEDGKFTYYFAETYVEPDFNGKMGPVRGSRRNTPHK